MSDVRLLMPDDFPVFTRIFAAAYPGLRLHSAEAQARCCLQLMQLQEQEPTIRHYGLFRSGQMVGGLQLRDFSLTFHTATVPAGGAGSLAVDLAHKRQHVAKELMEFFLYHYRQRGMAWAILYAFRPDFYRSMGFGYGSKMDRYRVHPAALPGGTKTHIRHLDITDRVAALACYRRYAAVTHGMLDRSAFEIDKALFAPGRHAVGYAPPGGGTSGDSGQGFQGYLAFEFVETDNFEINDLHVRELVFETPQALVELLAFLRSQRDQFRQVVIDTQLEGFHHLLLDPRDGANTLIPHVYHQCNTEGIGLMYRCVDVRRALGLLAERQQTSEDMCFTLRVKDSFLPDNSACLDLVYRDGRLVVGEETPAGPGGGLLDVELNIADFSSLLMGTVRLSTLYQYSLATISDPARIPAIERIFAAPVQPACMTPF